MRTRLWMPVVLVAMLPILIPMSSACKKGGGAEPQLYKIDGGFVVDTLAENAGRSGVVRVPMFTKDEPIGSSDRAISAITTSTGPSLDWLNLSRFGKLFRAKAGVLRIQSSCEPEITYAHALKCTSSLPGLNIEFVIYENPARLGCWGGYFTIVNYGGKSLNITSLDCFPSRLNCWDSRTLGLKMLYKGYAAVLSAMSIDLKSLASQAVDRLFSGNAVVIIVAAVIIVGVALIIAFGGGEVTAGAAGYIGGLSAIAIAIIAVVGISAATASTVAADIDETLQCEIREAYNLPPMSIPSDLITTPTTPSPPASVPVVPTPTPVPTPGDTSTVPPTSKDPAELTIEDVERLYNNAPRSKLDFNSGTAGIYFVDSDNKQRRRYRWKFRIRNDEERSKLVRYYVAFYENGKFRTMIADTQRIGSKEREPVEGWFYPALVGANSSGRHSWRVKIFLFESDMQAKILMDSYSEELNHQN